MTVASSLAAVGAAVALMAAVVSLAPGAAKYHNLRYLSVTWKACFALAVRGRAAGSPASARPNAVPRRVEPGNAPTPLQESTRGGTWQRAHGDGGGESVGWSGLARARCAALRALPCAALPQGIAALLEKAFLSRRKQPGNRFLVYNGRSLRGQSLNTLHHLVRGSCLRRLCMRAPAAPVLLSRRRQSECDRRQSQRWASR